MTGGAEPPRTRLRSNQSGFVMVFVALATVMLLGMMSLSIDLGHALALRQALQASTDAAATAGAMDIGVSGGDPVATATAYSSVAGNKNARGNMPGVSISAQVRCTNFMSQLVNGTDCTSSTTPANTIVVTQTMPAPIFFARVLGFNSLTIRTTATAGVRGGGPPPLDVAIVLDTTASMNGACSASVPGKSHPTRLDCAKFGVKTLLTSFWPCSQIQGACGTATNGNYTNPYDRVALLVFPGLKATAPVSWEFDCSNNLNTTHISPYGSSPVYTVVPLSSDYKTSWISGLNGGASNMVKSVAWGDGNSCTSNAYGAENPAGQGSYFSDAIATAQSTLASHSRTGVQKVIIFVSDGDANQYSGGPSNPCRSAITAADTAAATGTWVYSVAYGASTSSTSTCVDDSPHISAYSTMQQIASDASKFYNQPSSGDLSSIFTQIGQSLVNTRLLENGTL